MSTFSFLLLFFPLYLYLHIVCFLCRILMTCQRNSDVFGETLPQQKPSSSRDNRWKWNKQFPDLSRQIQDLVYSAGRWDFWWIHPLHSSVKTWHESPPSDLIFISTVLLNETCKICWPPNSLCIKMASNEKLPWNQTSPLS